MSDRHPGIKIVKKTIIFSASKHGPYTDEKCINAIAEVDEFNNPFSVEILHFRELVGEIKAKQIVAGLAENQVQNHYNDEVDALTFVFGEGWKSFGSRNVEISVKFIGGSVGEIALEIIPTN
jgi:hypothetical protein